MLLIAFQTKKNYSVFPHRFVIYVDEAYSVCWLSLEYRNLTKL